MGRSPPGPSGAPQPVVKLGRHEDPLEETFGVRVVEIPHTMADPDFLATHPEARADDLMAAFADPDIDGIVASIGGDDSIRILRRLDLGVIRDSPKVFCGYSDSTITHAACL
ncbi:MAG: LD-carboxypeptidase, partial [Actinobacteria bacterium]|nr:LD-carboxypeptidase [Actinomycetota bacterium]